MTAQSEQQVDRRTLWVAYTNTDNTEGRGSDVPIAYCSVEATAIRLAKGKYVQGHDGPVRPIELVKIDGEWYASVGYLYIEHPTAQDAAAQRDIARRREAVAKAKAAGLTDEDIQRLR